MISEVCKLLLNHSSFFSSDLAEQESITCPSRNVRLFIQSTCGHPILLSDVSLNMSIFDTFPSNWPPVNRPVWLCGDEIQHDLGRQNSISLVQSAGTVRFWVQRLVEACFVCSSPKWHHVCRTTIASSLRRDLFGTERHAQHQTPRKEHRSSLSPRTTESFTSSDCTSASSSLNGLQLILNVVRQNHPESNVQR